MKAQDVLPAVGVTAVFVLGLAGGYYLASVPFRTAIGHWYYGRTVGLASATDEDRAARAQAYLEPNLSPDTLYEYGWVPPNAFVPFVGAMPAPQTFKSITIQPDLTRGLTPVVMPKPKGELRVFLTGGSTAFSVGAPDEATTIAGFLEGFLRKNTARDVTVHTFCAPSWTSTHERIAIINRISEWAPDVVVSLSGVNDLSFSWRGSNTFMFRTHYERTFLALVEGAYKLAMKPVPTDPVVAADAPQSLDHALHRLSKNVRVARRVLAEVDADYVWALQPALVDTNKPLSARERGYLANVDEGQVEYTKRGYQRIRDVISVMEGNVTFTDVDITFAEFSSADEVFLDQYHFGDRGNRAVARHLARVIETRLTRSRPPEIERTK